MMQCTLANWAYINFAVIRYPHDELTRGGPLCLGLNGSNLADSANDLGKSEWFVSLGRNVLTLDERGVEEDKGIWEPRDMVL